MRIERDSAKDILLRTVLMLATSPRGVGSPFTYASRQKRPQMAKAVHSDSGVG